MVLTVVAPASAAALPLAAANNPYPGSSQAAIAGVAVSAAALSVVAGVPVIVGSGSVTTTTTAAVGASLTRRPKCPKNVAVTVSLTITQGKHVAEGHWSHTCTGGKQHWKITAPADGVHTDKASWHAVAKLTRGGKTLISKRWSGKLTVK